MDKNVLIIGTSASGKTYRAKELAAGYTGADGFSAAASDRLLFLHLHEGYSYDDVVAGIEVSAVGGKLQYNTVWKCFAKLCQEAGNHRGKKYAVIFDDIDRVNITDVFGELFYAVENRGEAVTLRTGESISVPENVLVIAVLRQPDAKFKPDYAFFRRFYIIELSADRNALKNGHERDAFDKYNGVVRKHIAPGFADRVNCYLLGHGLFMSRSETALKLKIYHQVIPLVKKYAEDGILNISSSEMSGIEAAAGTDVSSVPVDYIEKTVNGEPEQIVWQDKLNEMDGVFRNEPRGALARMVVHFFDLTRASGLLDTHTLMNDLYLNGGIVSISSHLNPSLPKGNILLPESLNVNNYKYPGGGAKNGYTEYVSLFYSDAKGKPLYTDTSTGIRYRLITGVREIGGGNAPICDPVAAVYAANLVYVLVENYYRIYLSKISRLPDTADLKAIVEDDLKWLQKGVSYKLLGNVSLYSEMKKELVVLWHRAGDTVSKMINGVRVSAVLKGASTMRNNDYMTIMNTIGVHQMILQGPPGTSKTHGVFEFIDSEIAKKHPGKKRADCRLTSADYAAAEEGKAITNQNKILWDSVQFHPSYGYEDFVRGIEVSTSNEQIRYDTVNKILGKICTVAAAGKDATVFLVIDEINRANVAAVFGELIYALEYRNEPVSTPYSVAAGSTLTIPDNLYILGTMNTADKSIGNIDYAIRRRFLFFPCLLDKDVIVNFTEGKTSVPGHEPKAVELFETVEKLFDDHLNEEYNKDDVMVGHTYFLAENNEVMKNRFIFQILPILREYVKDGILIKSSSALQTDAGELIAEHIFGYGSAALPTDENELWNDIYKSL
ncbi:MAG: AAA family ATPase [Ruminococcus sp.]|nr:AAA family ATPase [Ruminococcus sp.]